MIDWQVSNICARFNQPGPFLKDKTNSTVNNHTWHESIVESLILKVISVVSCGWHLIWLVQQLCYTKLIIFSWRHLLIPLLWSPTVFFYVTHKSFISQLVPPDDTKAFVLLWHCLSDVWWSLIATHFNVFQGQTQQSAGYKAEDSHQCHLMSLYKITYRK